MIILIKAILQSRLIDHRIENYKLIFRLHGRLNSWPSSWIHLFETEKDVSNSLIVIAINLKCKRMYNLSKDKTYPIWYRKVQDILHEVLYSYYTQIFSNCTKKELSLWLEIQLSFDLEKLYLHPLPHLITGYFFKLMLQPYMYWVKGLRVGEGMSWEWVQQV